MPKPSQKIQKQKQKAIRYIGFSLLGSFAFWLIWVEAIDPYRQVSIEEIPMIVGSSEPFKIKPEDPGGDKVLYTDMQIYQRLGENLDEHTVVERILPEEETPLFPKQENAEFKPNLPEKSNNLLTQNSSPVDDDTPHVQMPYLVQVASLRNREAAEQSQQHFIKKYPDIFANMNFHIKTVQIAGKGLFYRLYIGPYEKWEMAQKICTHLKTKNISCLIIQE